MKPTLIAVSLLLIAGLIGCASRQQAADGDIGYIAPASIYSVMDSTALVYTDVAAGSPLNDNPWRWLGFLLHPIGQGLDYGVNRPIYSLTSSMPYLFGYTSEDAMLDSQRSRASQY
ncbi:MAG: uncharacterized protein K0S79_1460 [Nitrospira sp.]|jgi:hypothetical protein|nr:uncharacterized protein [Nitrospira sp.]